jgi:hypothetical protein
LGKTVEQIEAEMSVDEFIEWSVYVQIQSDRQKQAMKKNGNSKARNPINR